MIRLLLSLLIVSTLTVPVAVADEKPFGGIGLQVVPTINGNLVVLNVIEGAPAEEKGLLPGDLIFQVDNYRLHGSDFGKVISDYLWGPVGSTVDVEDASYTNSIGDPLFLTYWKDPDFDPEQRAFYYVRVLEIPKPSWLAHDAKFYGLTMSDEVPMTVQDRVYTSPIWYTP